MRIININGPINSGKSTVSKLLCGELPSCRFVEVDELMSDEEEARMGLSQREGWGERVRRFEGIVLEEKQSRRHENLLFAYPMTESLYRMWKAWEDGETSFVNVTLAPEMEICLRNRGTRALEAGEKARIREMYAEGYQCPEHADLIIDNGGQTPEETVRRILEFLEGRGGGWGIATLGTKGGGGGREDCSRGDAEGRGGF